MKKFLILLLTSLTSFAAADVSISLVSSNQFKTGTNGIYSATLANLTTLSNAIIGNTYVSSNALVTSNWTALAATNLTAPTIASSSSITSSNLVVTNLLTVVGNTTLTGTLAQGGGLAILSILSTNATLDFPATATNQISTLDITLPGAGTNSAVFLNIITPNTNFTYSAYIGATNTVTVRAANISITDAANPDPTAARVTVFQY
jgi:hypothetical protein